MKTNDERPVYAASISCCPPASQLEVEWRTLEASANPPVFLSWAWIGAQVATFGLPAYLARVLCQGQVVGLALLGCGSRRVAAWLRRPSLHLNETGNPRHDAVMIEYNGVLTARDDEQAASALIDALVSVNVPLWRELHLGGVPDFWAERCRERGLQVRLLRAPQPAPFFDFNDTVPGDPLESLSRNSRQQIRRSLRWFGKRGPVTLSRANNVAEAIRWLVALEDLHGASWQARNKPGAFGNPWFGLFHRTLIERSFDEGIPDLLCIRTGPEVIGYLYNFVWRGWAYAYQSGLHYEENADCRPGLVAHLLAIRRYRDDGLKGYRFLAGNARYKTSFATGTDSLLWLAVHRSDGSHRLEGWLRSARHAVGAMLGRAYQ